MRVIIEGKDVSELIESITWSGDTKQVARKINFTIVKNRKDKNLSKIVINEGDKIILQTDSKKNLFGGVVFDIDKTSSSNVYTYLAYDLMFYVNNSDINKVFDDTPDKITKEVCAELGVECGTLASPNTKVYMPCLGKKGYEAIMMAYTEASRKNGKKYMPLMQSIDKLSVIEKGTQCGVVMNGDYNLSDANYKSSLQNLVNKVLITDKNGNVVKTVQDTDSQSKYGTVQVVYKQEDGKDATDEAKNMLKTAELSASINGVPSDHRAVSGYSIVVQEPDTGLYGKFYIESDSHTFTNGKSEMQLTLAFENLMDEKEIEKKEEKEG